MEDQDEDSFHEEEEEEEEDDDVEEVPVRSGRKLTEYEQLLQQVTHLDAKVFAGHIIDAVVDEVALEGLDGITVQALKVRLEGRQNFGMEGFEDVASAIWKQLKYVRSVRFYMLPSVRPDLVPYTWDEYRDERGNAYEPLHAPDDIYPYFPVEDKVAGIRGSCEDYKTRKEVTAIVRRVPYLESIRMFGNRLVIVANQAVREKAIFGSNYKMQKGLSVVQYCIMERVGRARFSGETTRGKISFTCMKIQPKTLFYMRKTLLNAGLLTRQPTSIKFINCRCPAGITVFHLPRFYKRIETIVSMNYRTIFASMNQEESKRIPTETLVAKYGKHTVRNLLNTFPELVEACWSRVDVESATNEKGKSNKVKQKSVRVVKLLVTDEVKQNQVFKKVMDRESLEDGETGGDAGDQEEAEALSSTNNVTNYANVKVLRPSCQLATTSTTYRLFHAVVKAGIKGLTLMDLTFLQTTPLESRSAVRFLIRVKVCFEGVVKNYKQKAFTYTFLNFHEKEREITFTLQEQHHNVINALFKLREEREERRKQRMIQRRLRQQERSQAFIDEDDDNSCTEIDENSRAKVKDVPVTNDNDASATDIADEDSTAGRKAPKKSLRKSRKSDETSTESSLPPSTEQIHMPATTSDENDTTLATEEAAKESPESIDKGEKSPSPPTSPSLVWVEELQNRTKARSPRTSSPKSDKSQVPVRLPGFVSVEQMRNRILNLCPRRTPLSLQKNKSPVKSQSPLKSHSKVKNITSVELSQQEDTSPIRAEETTNKVTSPTENSNSASGPTPPSTLEVDNSESTDLSTTSEAHLVTIVSTGEIDEKDEYENSENYSGTNSLDSSFDDDDFGPVINSHETETPDDEITSDQDDLELQELQVEAMNILDGSKRGDLIDEELRNRMTRQRVDWNPHDDRFVILAFVASALFIHKYNFVKVFIYNATQIRDLLLKKTDGKSTKTSLAIRRRLHFLMNQKSQYDMYIGLMGAALRDEELYERFVKDNLRPPQVRIYYNPPLEALGEAVNYLYQKFDSEEYVVTDSRVSFNGIDSLLFIRQVTRLDLYWKAMNFIIFCPMGKSSKSRRQFKQFWSNYISEFGTDSGSDVDSVSSSSSSSRSSNSSSISSCQETSDDDEGGNAGRTGKGFEALFHRPAVDIESSSSSGDSDSSEGDIEDDEEDDDDAAPPRPQDLEADYSFKLFKFIVKQCRIILGSMLILKETDKNSFALVSFDLSALYPNICYSHRELESDQEIRMWTARALVLDLIFAGDLSRTVEKSVVDNLDVPVERATKSLRRARVLVCNKSTRVFAISRFRMRQFNSGLSSSSYDEILDFLKYIDEVPNVDSAACISSGILLGMVELTDYFKPCFRITESIFTLNDEWVPVYDDIMEDGDIATKNSKKSKRGRKGPVSPERLDPYKRCRLTEEEEGEIEDLIDCFEDIEKDIIPKPGRPKKAGLDGGGDHYASSSTNALRLLRIRLNEAGVQMPRKQFTGFVERDFFAINLPNLEFTLPNKRTLNHRLAGTSHPFNQHSLKELRKILVEVVYHHVSPNMEIDLESISKYLGKYTVLFKLIDCTGSAGLSGEYLLSQFEAKSLAKGIRYLVDARLVFTVGVTQRRFVTFNNVRNWLIPIRTALGNKTVGHVVMRPWITVLGSLSWVTINRLFIAILGQLQRPSIPFDELSQALRPTLSDVEVIILIEAMVKLKYLMAYRISETEASMFSENPRDNLEIEYKVDTLVDTENIYIAVSPYTTILHAQLQEAAFKASKWSSAKKDETNTPNDSE